MKVYFVVTYIMTLKYMNRFNMITSQLFVDIVMVVILQ